METTKGTERLAYEPITAGLVLTGGRSRRMGTDKASLPLLGRPLASWVVGALRTVLPEVWLIGGTPSLARELGVRHAPDLVPGAGPLAGICSGLRAAGRDVLVSACDTPLLQAGLLRTIAAEASGYDIAIPLNGDNCEPLIGVYRFSCLGAMEEALAAGERQVRSVYRSLRVRYVPELVWRHCDPRGLSFVNVNSPAELERVIEELADAAAEETWQTRAVS